MSASKLSSQRSGTWILTVNCSEQILTLCDDQLDRELGVGLYRLMGLLRMGIVIIDRLPDSPETMWLKMLGNRESAQSAFQYLFCDVRKLHSTYQFTHISKASALRNRLRY